VSQIFEVESAVAEKFAHFRAVWRTHRHPGAEPRTLLVRHVHVAETDRAAREEAEPFMLKGIQGPAGVERALRLLPEESTPDTRELARVYLETSRSVDFWLDEGLAFVGSPESVTEAIAAQRRRVGYDILLLNHQFVDMPRELYVRSMSLFGERVVPAFAPGARVPAAPF
jgi:alkanesulfonate monooxygenase SsuD/methylene tetrahydromethanopterin reductase-like flavin-dependent oxidoreductase (luciferase family)